MNASDAVNIHASAIICGEAGILLRGPSGAGKSSLALDLITAATAAGLFSRLVADDRVMLSRAGGRLLARPHEAIAGLIEVYGIGIARTSFESQCLIRMVIDLGETSERLPQQREIDILGIKIYHVVMQQGMIVPARILDALFALTKAPHRLDSHDTKVI